MSDSANMPTKPKSEPLGPTSRELLSEEARSNKPATLQRYLSSLHTWHVAHGHASPVQTETVRRVMDTLTGSLRRGIRREPGRAIDRRNPDTQNKS